MKKFDVIVVGELNVDLILNKIQSLPQIGKEVLAEQMHISLGSSSAIFASNLSSLGNSVAFLGMLGQDQFGEIVLQALKARQVDTSHILQSKRYATGASVALNYQEDRAMLTYPGAMQHFCLEDIDTSIFSQASHLHISSYFLQSSLRPDIGKLFRLAKEAGLTTSFDPQWDPEENWEIDLAEILPYVDIFLPNEAELLQLTAQPSWQAAIDTIKAFSNVVVIKRGRQGSVVAHQGEYLEQPPFLNREVVDAIGAGDSFNAGFIHQYIRQASMEYCQRFGNLAGAVSTTAAGGTAAFNNFKEIAKEKFGYQQHETTR